MFDGYAYSSGLGLGSSQEGTETALRQVLDRRERELQELREFSALEQSCFEQEGRAAAEALAFLQAGMSAAEEQKLELQGQLEGHLAALRGVEADRAALQAQILMMQAAAAERLASEEAERRLLQAQVESLLAERSAIANESQTLKQALRVSIHYFHQIFLNSF